MNSSSVNSLVISLRELIQQEITSRQKFLASLNALCPPVEDLPKERIDLSAEMNFFCQNVTDVEQLFHIYVMIDQWSNYEDSEVIIKHIDRLISDEKCSPPPNYPNPHKVEVTCGCGKFAPLIADIERCTVRKHINYLLHLMTVHVPQENMVKTITCLNVLETMANKCQETDIANAFAAAILTCKAKEETIE